MASGSGKLGSSDSDLATQPQAATLAAVAVKLPALWVDKPKTWFIQAEAQFRLSGITREETKFFHVLAALPPTAIESITDIVESFEDGGEEEPYTAAKMRILGDLSETKWSRMSKILHHEGLGDQRPSAMMNRMLALMSKGDKPGDLFMAVFMDRLPEDMRALLSLGDFRSPKDMAAAADQIWDAKGARGAVPTAVTAVRPPSRSPSRSPANQDRDRRSQKARRPSTPGPAGGGKGQRSQLVQLCRFHAKFGDKAYSCQPGCSWSGNGQAGQRRN
jgi:hypothetical protein